MIEQICEIDDPLLEHFLEVDMNADKIDSIRLRDALRRGCVSGKCIPVLAGASFRNIGVQTLMDAVVDYLPSPMDRPDTTGYITATSSGGKVVSEKLKKESIALTDSRMFCLAFKIIHDKNRGPLVFVRVYSGLLLSF
jgi:elongation factor G